MPGSKQVAQTEVRQDAADYNRVPANWKGTDRDLHLIIDSSLEVMVRRQLSEEFVHSLELGTRNRLRTCIT